MNKTTQKIMFSSENPCWETPPDFFKKYDDIYHFTLDPCASHENAKCKKYFTIKEDGLSQDWGGKIVYLNPPYNKPEQPCKKNCTKKGCKERGFHIDEYVPGKIDWVRKAFHESRKPGCVVVALLPVRTDTKEFHKYIYGKANIEFIKGRIKFVGAKASAPFPSMIVVWGL